MSMLESDSIIQQGVTLDEGRLEGKAKICGGKELVRSWICTMWYNTKGLEMGWEDGMNK